MSVRVLRGQRRRPLPQTFTAAKATTMTTEMGLGGAVGVVVTVMKSAATVARRVTNDDDGQRR